MTTAMKKLGIDRMTVHERAELALDIWHSIEAQIPSGSISEEDEAELDRRDREMDNIPDSGMTWAEFRKRLQAGRRCSP